MANDTLITRPNLQKACDYAGGQTALAELIGESQKLVWHLLHRANSIKADVALKISRATNVPIEDIIADFSSESEAA